MSDRQLNRRRVLATLGASSVGLLSGCNQLTAPPDGTPEEPSDQTPTPSETPPLQTDTPTNEADTDTSTPADDGLIWVSADDGEDDWSGTGDRPLETVQAALDRARPGDTIRLMPGEYREEVVTVRDGESEAPITITGPPEAVIRAHPKGNTCLAIEHSHVHVTGITLDGLSDPDRKFDDHEAWASWCVVVSPISRYEEGVEYLRNVVIEPSRIGNCGRAMIQATRLRNASIGNFRVIGPVGMQFDERVANHDTGHVREFVYIGTPAPHRGRPHYKYETLDRSRNIRLHHIDNSAGYRHSELVDVKLGSTDVTIEYCTDRNGGHNTEGGISPNVNLNGRSCTVRWNDIRNCPLPFSLGAWAPGDDIDGGNWARDHAIYGNIIRDFLTGPFKMRDLPEQDIGPTSFEAQRIMCGNQIERGSPSLHPWIGKPNGFDGGVDRRDQDEVTVAVGAGPNGRALDPAVVFVDPGATITWEWTGDGDPHYIVRTNRLLSNPDSLPDPMEAPYSESDTIREVGVHEFACQEHYEDGMWGAVIAVGSEDRYTFARDDCKDVPEGDGIGHTGGDSPWA